MMKRGALALAAVAVLILFVTTAQAVDPTQMPTPALQERYLALTHELRCMQCQNESIADSPVDLAADLRRAVRDMLLAENQTTTCVISWSPAMASSSCSGRACRCAPRALVGSRRAHSHRGRSLRSGSCGNARRSSRRIMSLWKRTSALDGYLSVAGWLCSSSPALLS